MRELRATSLPNIHGPHDIAVTFLNDAYGGTPPAPTATYVNSIQIDDKTIAASSASLMSAGTQRFSVIAAANLTV